MRSDVFRYAAAFLDVAERAPEAELPTVAKRLVAALTRRRQRKLLPKILRAVEQQWNERHGIVPVRLRTARPIDQSLLAELFGSATPVSTKIEEYLLGGVVLERGDQLIDASVQSKLRRLHTALTRKE